MLKKLYDTIKGEGYYTKSYEEFQDQYKDDKYVQKVFDTVSEEGLYTNSFEEFKSKYTIDPPKKKDKSKPIGGKKDTTESTTEQDQGKNGSSDSSSDEEDIQLVGETIDTPTEEVESDTEETVTKEAPKTEQEEQPIEGEVFEGGELPEFAIKQRRPLDKDIFDPMSEDKDFSDSEISLGVSQEEIPQAETTSPEIPTEKMQEYEEYLAAKPDIEIELKKRQQEEEREKNKKEQDEINARNLLISTPEFIDKLETINKESINLNETDAKEYFAKEFGDYGFSFFETGIGDALEVTAPNKKTYTVDLQSFFSDQSEIDGLKDFIKSNATIADYNISEGRDVGNKKEQEYIDFFNKRGLNYGELKKNEEEFNKVEEKLDFIEGMPFNDSSLTKEEKEKYGDLYINGYRRDDINEIESELESRRDFLYSYFDQNEDVMRAKEDWDALQAKEQKEYEKSIGKNLAAVIQEKTILDEGLNQTKDYFKETFGLDIEEAIKTNFKPPANINPKSYDDFITNYKLLKSQNTILANEYEWSKSYINTKFDKNFRDEFVNDAQSILNAGKVGLSRGKAQNEILKVSLGITDLPDDASTLDFAKRLIQYMEDAETGKTGRAQYRFHAAKGFMEAFRAFRRDPIELGLTLASESLTQMLPYGIKVVPATTITGAGLGSLFGPGGTLAGAAKGLRTGVAATALALEYTNAVLEAITNQGYDVQDPMSLAKGLKDDLVWKEGKEIGLKRGIPIAMMDYLSTGMAGRVFKTSRTASRGKKISSFAAERFVFDPIMEGAGEAAAMINAGQELDAKEILAEMAGAFGQHTPTAVINMYMDGKLDSDKKVADKLTNISNFVNDNASAKEISVWANNQEALGKISKETNQKIQKNAGFQKDANELLDAGETTPSKNKKDVEIRLMELLKAKEELSSSEVKASAFAPKISEITQEIQEIANTKELRPKNKRTKLVGDAAIFKIAPLFDASLTEEEKAIVENGGILRNKKYAFRVVPKDLTSYEGVKDSDRGYTVFTGKQLIESGFFSNAKESFEKKNKVAEEAAPEVEVKEKVTEEAAPEVKVELEQAKTPGEQITTTEEQTLFKGMQPKKKDGKPFSVHKVKKGSFAAVDEQLASDYKGDQPLKKFTVPAGTTVDVVQVEDTNQPVSEVRRQEEKLIDDSDAQVVKLITRDSRGVVEEQYIIKDDAILETSEDVIEEAAIESESIEEDLKKTINDEATGQFQLETTDPSKDVKLNKRAKQLMEELQPELSEKTYIVSESSAKAIPVTIIENAELAKRIGKKMTLKDLEGKKINLAMADQLKVDKNKMGGPFFGVQDGVYGKGIAWASITPEAAREIIKGSIDSDYTVVFNMDTPAFDSNITVFNSLVDKIKQSPNGQNIFKAMMDDIKSKKYKKKTKQVHKAASESKNIDDFAKEFANLDVDTRAKIFRDVLPSTDIKSKTKIGKLFSEEGIFIESIRDENKEQFASDLPMGAMTMVLKITDENGKPITKDNIDDAIVTREQQEKEGIKTHENYPVYIRGEVVAMMSETVPFYSVNKDILNTINAKIDGVIRRKTTKKEREKGAAKTKRTTSGQAKADAKRQAELNAQKKFVVEAAQKTNYERFVTKLAKAFPNVEVVSDEVQFKKLFKDLYDQKLITNKKQKLYGAIVNGKLYLNPSLENYNTPIHEFGHIWMNTARELSPDLYNKGIALVKGTKYESDIRNNKAYKNIIKKMKADGATESEINQYILEEALATAIGNKGQSFVNAAIKKNFKAWIDQLFDFVKKITGISNLTSEQLQDLSLDEFTEAVVADLLSEEKAFEEAEKVAFENEMQLMLAPDNKSIYDIVAFGRSKGYNNATIREMLQEKKFKKKDIDAALEVDFDVFTKIPKQFERISGGISNAIKLFENTKKKLDKYISKNKKSTATKIRQEATKIVKADPIFKEQNPQVQQEILIGIQESIDLDQGNFTFRKKIENIRKNLKNRKIGSRDLTKVKKEIKDFIIDNLIQSQEYTKTSISKLIKIIDRTNIGNIKREADKAFDELEKVRNLTRNSLANKIVGQVRNKSKLKDKSIDPTLKNFYIQAKSIIGDIKKSKSSDKKVAKQASDRLIKLQSRLNENAAVIKELQQRSSKGESLSKKERDLLNDQLAYDMFNGIYDMSLEEVQKVFDQVKEMTKKSIERLKASNAIKSKKQADIEAKANEQIIETNPELFDEDGVPLTRAQRRRKLDDLYKRWNKNNIPQKLKEFVKNVKYTKPVEMLQWLINPLVSTEVLSNIADLAIEGKNVVRENVYDKLNIMHTKSLDGLFKTKEKFDNIAKSFGFDNYKDVKIKLHSLPNLVLPGMVNSKTGKDTRNLFASSDVLHLYALTLNEKANAQLEKMGLNAENKKRIKEYLGKELTDFADGLVDFLSNDYYEGINKVFTEVNGRDLGYIADYFPLFTEVDVDMKEEFLANNNFEMILDAETSAHLKQRNAQDQDVDLDRLGFIEALDRYVNSMEKYKAYTVGTKELNSFLNIPSVKTLLQALSIDNMMRILIQNDISPNALDSSLTKLMNKVQSKFSSYVLAFKPVQTIKQSTSSINAFDGYRYNKGKMNAAIDLPMFLIDLAKVYGSISKDLVGKYGSISQMMDISPDAKMRILQAARGETFSLESGRELALIDKAKRYSKTGRAISGFRTAKGFFTSIGDVLGVMGHLAVYKRDIENGMDQEEALKKFNDYNSSQQTRRGSDRNWLQNRNDVITRAVVQFGSTGFAMLNKVLLSSTNIGRSLSKGKMPRQKDVRTLALHLGLANALFVAASNIFKFAFGDDDDLYAVWNDVMKALSGFNLFYQIPIVGTAAEGMDIGAQIIIKGRGDSYFDKKKRYTVTEGPNPFLELYRKTVKLQETDGYFNKTLRPIAEIALGAQADPFIAIYNMSIATDEDVKIEEAMNALGITESYKPEYYKSKTREARAKKVEEQEGEEYFPTKRGGSKSEDKVRGQSGSRIRRGVSSRRGQ